MTRGSSKIRATLISCSNVVSHASTRPLTGAASDGSAVHASGRCPSPARSPDVGSSPIHPAPGT
ncbi:MAG: hypothetical protein KIS78_11840 [Labilithrix sp.]|nr:hypothetical protein [Labilithrix sp.]